MPRSKDDAPERSIPSALAAGDVMSRPPVFVEPSTPVPEVLARMVAEGRRAVPVADHGFPVGIVTERDLVARGGVALDEALVAEARAGGGGLDRPFITRLGESGRCAREIMTPGPVTIPEATPLRAAAEAMARRRLKRLPVVGGDGRLVGVLSRVDVLRAAAGGGWDTPDGGCEAGLDGRAPVSEVMRRDPPTVAPGARLALLVQVVATSGIDRALVVDEARRVLGVVSDAALLDRITPPLRRGVFSGTLQGLPFAHQDREAAERRASARTAAEIMSPVPTAPPELPLGDAAARLLGGGHPLLAVVDLEGRLLGAVDRAALLGGLVRSR